MPRYDYRCKGCQLVHEFVLPMSDKPQVMQCPECGKKMVRLFSPPNVNLRQGESETIRRQSGSITKHWDGRQDATVSPPMIGSGTEVPLPVAEET